jgi:hypothetical protein
MGRVSELVSAPPRNKRIQGPGTAARSAQALGRKSHDHHALALDRATPAIHSSCLLPVQTNEKGSPRHGVQSRWKPPQPLTAPAKRRKSGALCSAPGCPSKRWNGVSCPADLQSLEGTWWGSKFYAKPSAGSHSIHGCLGAKLLQVTQPRSIMRK